MAERYKMITVNGRRTLYHRWVMEQHLGRRLSFHEQVHHKNEDTFDNRLENLQVMTPLEHQRHHKQFLPVTKNCELCGAKYTPHKTKRRRQMACSNKCARILAGRSRSTLTLEQLHRIIARFKEGLSTRQVADEFGLTMQNAWRIKRGKGTRSLKFQPQSIAA